MGTDDYPDICHKTTEVPSTYKYVCPYGYELNETKCILKKTVPETIENVCDFSGMYDPYTSFCHIIGVFSSCPSGTFRYSTGKHVTCASIPRKILVCPSGTTKTDTGCYSEITKDANYIPTCETGFNISSDGSMCSKTERKTPSYEITCSKDFNMIQDKTTTIKAKKYTYCPDNYEMIDNSCILYDIKDAIKEK